MREKPKLGIIDVGSNTILGVVFRWDALKKAYRCFSLSDGLTIHAKLLQYVQNGILSKEGLQVLMEALKQIHVFFTDNGVDLQDVSCFATASLRGISNFKDAESAAAENGFVLQLLSGEEEAECDLLGMEQELNWLEKEGYHFPEAGVAVDLGGGSGQVLCFSSREEKKPDGFGSFPIGCLALRKRFLANPAEPSDRELEEMRSFVCTQIETIPMIKALPYSLEAPEKTPAFFAMGGTVKAILRLADRLHWETEKTEKNSFSIQTLIHAETYFQTKEGQAVLREYEPGRVETILPGVVALLTICRRIGAQKITVLQSGVREGYVVRKYGK